MTEQSYFPFAVSDAKKFLLAGNAYLTAESERTGTHYTFRVQRAKPREEGAEPARLWFVAVLTGPDNEHDYEYLGLIRPPQGQRGPLCYEYGLNSRINRSAPCVKAIDWVVRHILRDRPMPNCVVHHEGRCGRCGRTLTVPESIESGYGPECIQYV